MDAVRKSPARSQPRRPDDDQRAATPPAASNAELLSAEIRHLRRVEAQLRASQRVVRAQLRALLEIGQASTANLTLAELLRKIMASATNLLGASAAAVWRLDEQGTLQRLSSEGLSREYVQAVANLEVGEGVTGLVALSAHPLAVADVASDSRVRSRPLWEQEGIRSFLAAPLLRRGQPVGVLSIYRRDVHEFTPAEVALLVSFSAHAATAIENALLYARTGRAEAAASRHRELLQNVIFHAEDGILALDSEWRILLFSPGCERLTGWQEAEAVGRVCFEVLRAKLSTGSPLDADTIARALDTSGEQAEMRADEQPAALPPLLVPSELGSSGGTPEGPADSGTEVPYLEMRLRARHGDERWVGASLAEVVSRRRGTPRIVLVLRDITVAKEMDELKSSLISTVSHELRTPLTSLRALSELLLEHVLAPDQSRELAGHINAEAVRLSRLVDNILDVTRIEAGGLTSEPQRLDLEALLREAIAVVQGQVLEGGPHFVLEPSPQLLTVWADRDHLGRVLDNLLGNALRYVPAGAGVRVQAFRVETADVPEPEWDMDSRVRGNDGTGVGGGAAPVSACGPFVEISVVDEGPGIAAEHLPHIFDKFYQVEGQHRLRRTGTGLGLYIARNLVELMSGTLRVESELGRGATFRFTVPVAPDCVQRQDAPAPVAGSAAAPAAANGPEA